jgi:hypothetical protein
MLFKRIASPFNKVMFAAFNKQFNQRKWIISDFKLIKANIKASYNL